MLQATAGRAVLHFATHAIVRGDEPLSSFLALAASGDDDGRLTAQEIYRLRLDADLVVLSACRSAGGRVTGDGIATFARAFIYAGAPSIVASVWDVADEPTNRLLPAFYRAWLGGASKARALRTAQLGLMNDLRAGKIHIVTPAGPVSLPEHPVFWASVVDEVRQLQDVHVPDGDRVVVRLAGATVVENGLAVVLDHPAVWP